ncbi:hypothetical protein M0804_014679 [Polistes exclamans]|nr:hypothetical protein M0804_014691 [Polistes exclamans]KAI4474777.1 hypothetical protein M0804_014679 [Polistes exclamans]
MYVVSGIDDAHRQPEFSHSIPPDSGREERESPWNVFSYPSGIKHAPNSECFRSIPAKPTSQPATQPASQQAEPTSQPTNQPTNQPASLVTIGGLFINQVKTDRNSNDQTNTKTRSGSVKVILLLLLLYCIAHAVAVVSGGGSGGGGGGDGVAVVHDTRYDKSRK